MVEIPGGDLQPLAAVLVSTVATMLIIASYRRPNVREFWSILAALLKFGIVASMLPAVLDGETFRWSMGEFVFGIEFALRVDTLGMVFALLASFLWIFTAFYCAGYMRGLNEPNQTRFFAAFAASLSTAIGIAFAENLIVMFLFYELLSIVTYPLVAHDETDEARAAGRKYLAYTFFGGGFLVLGGTALVYWLTGLADPARVSGVAVGESTATVTFGEIGEPLMAVYQGSVVSEPIFMLAFGMLALGFGTKAAIMPLHSWLPDAMVAPTPVSGLLHAVAVVKSGAFGVSRVVLDVYEPDLTAALDMHIALGGLAAASFILASFIALRKDHLKRRLAYSTASQLSYIIMGVALLSPAGITGGLLHIPAHAFMKLTLFFCAGAIHVETHTDYISNMAGIGKRMPLTMTAFTIAAAGMAGIPFVAGFVSKFYMLIGAIGMTDASYAYEPTAAGAIFALALIVSGVMNIAYFWPVVYTAFFESEDEHDAKPLVEFPIGGKFFSPGDEEVAADGGHTEESDGDEFHVSEQAHEEANHDVHHGGPPPSGWERRSPREESTWLILMPIAVIVTGAVVLGTIPGEVGFLDLVTAVAERATGLEVGL
ncbi:proton-conducting transporter transmembrane domain-containing protein [Halovenus sp. HT40]|uniref:proton-conducting transporter transmembrane domain-containing protein n=1 Tax=Halovenus sp. HT40 TaxID=3126691 RepID=UPI00300E708A